MLTYDPVRHHRRSVRLKDRDYSRAGAYCVTVCTKDRACLSGEIVNGVMRLNAYGQCVVRCWQCIPNHFAAVKTDAFVAMPNHIHGIVVITETPVVGAGFPRPGHGTIGNATGTVLGLTQGAGKRGAETAPLPPRRPSLGNVIALFKYQSAKQINVWRHTPAGPVWQRNYYEHIIRDGESLDRIRHYIADNPARWAFDRDNPAVPGRPEADPR
ncbi:MAG: transposase [Acidobacteriota bacterium]